jgi:hypothetical protein
MITSQSLKSNNFVKEAKRKLLGIMGYRQQPVDTKSLLADVKRKMIF